MAAFHFLFTCLLLLGLQGYEVPDMSHVPMVLPELLGGQVLAEQLIAAGMESLGTMGVWLL